MGVKEFRSALSSHQTLFLDTTVFSYHLGEHAAYVDLTTAVLETVERGENLGLTTYITLLELLTYPAQRGDQEAVRDYELFMTGFPNLRIVPLELGLARASALVRAALRLKTPDAVQVAAAQLHRADAIITNDRAWAKRAVGVPVLTLDDYRE